MIQFWESKRYNKKKREQGDWGYDKRIQQLTIESRLGRGKVRPDRGQQTGRKLSDSEVKEQTYGGVKS